jgi:hypothetical protein
MIVSKYGKSYDTSNGSEQHSAATQPQARGGPSSANARWEDDGGFGGVLSVRHPVVLSAKPGWSVLSLRDLMAAIQRSADPESPERVRQEVRWAEEVAHVAAGERVAAVANAARAEADRHRNPWENT